MRVTTLLSACFLLFAVAEKLEKHRRSCANRIIFIKTAHFWSQTLELRNPGHPPELWEAVVNYECKLRNPGERCHSTLDEDEELEKIRELERRHQGDYLTVSHPIGLLFHTETLHRSLIESLLNVTSTKEYFNSDIIKTYVANEHFPIDLFPGMRENFTVRDGDVIVIEKKMTRDVKCICRESGSFAIQLSVEVMKPRKQAVWKCEDIGLAIDDHYEFFHIPSVWIATVEGSHQYIDESKCNEELSVCERESFVKASCSVEETKKCAKIVMSRTSSGRSSNARKLPGGVAVYGTFERRVEHSEDDKPAISQMDLGLYYFSFDA